MERERKGAARHMVREIKEHGAGSETLSAVFLQRERDAVLMWESAHDRELTHSQREILDALLDQEDRDGTTD